MKLKSITSGELPEWFKLSRYEGMESLNLAEWVDSLMERRVFSMARDDNLHLFTSNFCEWVSGDGSMLITGVNAISGRDGSNPQFADTEYSILNQVTVRSLDVDYCAFLIGGALHDDDEPAEQLRSVAAYVYQDANTVGGVERDENKEALLSQPIDVFEINASEGGFDPQYCRVEVDLHAPDKLIIEDFKKWLQGAREVFDVPSRNLFTKAKLQRWAKNKVLPYIDLTLWARFEGVKIPDAVMGNALFPDDGHIDDSDRDICGRIRKVVRKDAKYVSQASVVDAMWHQSRDKEHNF